MSRTTTSTRTARQRSAADTQQNTATEPVQHLRQIDLARRWRISPRTLERWRWLGQGPAFLRLGSSVAYRIADVEAFEAAQLQAAGTDRGAPELSKAELLAMGRRA